MIWFIVGFGLFMLVMTYPRSCSDYNDDNGESYYTVDKPLKSDNGSGAQNKDGGGKGIGS